MKKENKKHDSRVKKLIIGCGICGIILSASTYAWFIGMKTVDVNSFDVKIAAIDGLSLSLNGKDWADSVAINEGNYNDTTVVYEGNTNSWGGSGLIPMSSVGLINETTSRLTLFEKGSFTQVPGGYRVMASEVPNKGDAEASGYVAFDLFIKNLSGNEYYKDLNYLNEEAIYLTPDSEVTVAEDGGVKNTGIENSVRVAFAQIGRVVATTDDGKGTNQAKITGITCNAGETKDADVTGICGDRTAQIWEPNDKAHVKNAINYYNTNCDARTGTDVTLKASYTARGEDGLTTCSAIADGTAYPTYAISGEVNYSDNINVYDGAAYNTYTTSVVGLDPAVRNDIKNKATAGKLISFPYFTDTMKDIAGVNRPALITLAPNSITKVRVYIWIEGQDVDNYDFASLGKKISVAFGFSKEQLYGEDIDYNGDNVTDKGPNLEGENDQGEKQDYQSRNPQTTTPEVTP